MPQRQATSFINTTQSRQILRESLGRLSHAQYDTRGRVDILSHCIFLLIMFTRLAARRRATPAVTSCQYVDTPQSRHRCHSQPLPRHFATPRCHAILYYAENRGYGHALLLRVATRYASSSSLRLALLHTYYDTRYIRYYCYEASIYICGAARQASSFRQPYIHTRGLLDIITLPHTPLISYTDTYTLFTSRHIYY